MSGDTCEPWAEDTRKPGAVKPWAEDTRNPGAVKPGAVKPGNTDIFGSFDRIQTPLNTQVL